MIYTSRNCWFCNQNTRVFIFKRNSWTCEHCDQYNGFDKTGDYNKEIKEMHTIKNEFDIFKSGIPATTYSTRSSVYKSSNCLCEKCNHNQEIKLDKISSFQPRNEKTYELELKFYKQYLDKLYDLCFDCKSKVKFEITKQDGMLKNYLLKMGIHDFFFESSTSSVHSSKSLASRLKTKPKSYSFTPKSSSYLKNILNFVKFLLIFYILTLLILMITFTSLANLSSYKSMQFLKSFFNSNIKLKYEPIISNMLQRTQQTIQNCFENLFNLSQAELSKHVNARFPIVSLLFYLLCLFNISTLKAIFSLNTLFIIVNFDYFLNYYQSLVLNEASDETLGLQYSSIVIPLFIIVLMLEFFISIKYQFSEKPPLLNNKHFNHNLNNLSNSGIVNPQSKHYDSSAGNHANNESTPSYNNMASPYSIIKYLNSNDDRVLKSNAILATRTTQSLFFSSREKSNLPSSVIRPARFLPSSASNGPQGGSTSDNSWCNNSCDSCSDDGSIVSGLTNLYLNKHAKKQSFHQKVKLVDDDINHMNGNASGYFDQCSFYQSATKSNTMQSRSFNGNKREILTSPESNKSWSTYRNMNKSIF